MSSVRTSMVSWLLSSYLWFNCSSSAGLRDRLPCRLPHQLDGQRRRERRYTQDDEDLAPSQASTPRCARLMHFIQRPEAALRMRSFMELMGNDPQGPIAAGMQRETHQVTI